MLSKNQIRELHSLQLKKNRDAARTFIVEGIKAVEEVLNINPGMVRNVYGTSDFLAGRRNALTVKGIRFDEVDDAELKKISLQQSPNQVLALCHYLNDAELAPDFENNFYFFLDDIRDPGNFGTIIRLSAWFGLGALFCSPASCDLYNPKVIQSTMGAFLHVPVVYSPLEEVLRRYRPGQVYGAVLEGNNLFKENLKGGIIVVGNEANGISKGNLLLLNRRVTVPSGGGGTESLNAAVASSIIAAEFFRQLRHQ
jgi:TrmH family RNA methyltransferase